MKTTTELNLEVFFNEIPNLAPKQEKFSHFEDSLINYFYEEKKAKLTDELYKTDQEYFAAVAQF